MLVVMARVTANPSPGGSVPGTSRFVPLLRCRKLVRGQFVQHVGVVFPILVIVVEVEPNHLVLVLREAMKRAIPPREVPYDLDETLIQLTDVGKIGGVL